MKLSQKKTCEGCRAINSGQGFSSGTCELGFNNAGPLSTITFGNRSTTIRKFEPQELCYKPRTIPEYYEAKQLVQLQRTTTSNQNPKEKRQ